MGAEPAGRGSAVEDRAVRWGMGDAVLGTVLTVLVPLVVGGIALAAAGVDTEEELDDLPLWSFALLQVPLWAGLVGAPVLASYAKGLRDLAADFGLRVRAVDLPLGLGAGVVAQLLLLPLLVVLMDAVGFDTDRIGEAAEDLTDGASGPLDVVFLVVIVGLAAPVFEELFYRGLWLRAIERRAGTTAAVLGSSVLFGAIHFQQADFVLLTAFGLVAAVLTVRTGRLGAAIWAHLAFNLTAVVGLLA